MIATIIVSGGGSGGHIYPALAVARELPDYDVVFVGAKGHLEERIVPREGLAFRALPVSGFNRKRSAEKALAVVRGAGALLAAVGLLRRLRPVAVLGTGGYATVPVGLAAAALGVPLFVLEANATFGLANRLLVRRARRVFLAFAGAAAELPAPLRAKAVVAGFPVRPEVVAADRTRARHAFGLAPEDTVLLVSGGSQGADAVNRAAARVVESGMPVRLIWATGERYFGRWEGYGARPGVDLRPYIHEMPQALAAADVVLARAGASTLSEITARGLPSVLIPSPNVPDDHQRRNALYLERLGAARVVDEDDLDRHLLPTLGEVLEPATRARMAEAARSVARPDAARRIAFEMRKVVEEGR